MLLSRPNQSGRNRQTEGLRLGLEGVLALREHLPRLGQLCLGGVGALADGDLLLQLGDGVCDAGAQGAEDVLGLLCGLFLQECESMMPGVEKGPRGLADLLLEDVVGVLVQVGALLGDVLLELGDAGLLAGEVLVVVGLLLDEALDG